MCFLAEKLHHSRSSAGGSRLLSEATAACRVLVAPTAVLLVCGVRNPVLDLQPFCSPDTIFLNYSIFIPIDIFIRIMALANTQKV